MTERKRKSSDTNDEEQYAAADNDNNKHQQINHPNHETSPPLDPVSNFNLNVIYPCPFAADVPPMSQSLSSNRVPGWHVSSDSDPLVASRVSSNSRPLNLSPIGLHVSSNSSPVTTLPQFPFNFNEVGSRMSSNPSPVDQPVAQVEVALQLNSNSNNPLGSTAPESGRNIGDQQVQNGSLQLPLFHIRRRRPRPRPIRANANSNSDSETERVKYPWATDQPTVMHTMNLILEKGITKIPGEVKCKKCEKKFEIEYDLEEKFKELAALIVNTNAKLHQRALPQWSQPPLLKCQFCKQEKSCKPTFPKANRNINWLFLLLGQLLGFCTLDQLKYFCKKVTIHRTGAKNRVLFDTYVVLCNQLCPKETAFENDDEDHS